MADKSWKALERAAAALIGGKRLLFAGDQGDATSEHFVAFCKARRTLSLHELEAEALTAAVVAGRDGRIGIAVVKRIGGRGVKTPMLVVLTAGEWRRLMGTLLAHGGV